MSVLTRFCRNTGESIETCFCTDCLIDDMPPSWTTEPNEIVMGDDELTVTYVEEQIKLMTATVRKANRIHMAFNVKAGKTSSGKKKQTGIQFLQPSDLSTNKKRVTIKWAGDPEEAGNKAEWAKVTLKVEAAESGMKRLWTMGDTNPCFDTLVEAMGDDAEKWIGRDLFLFIEIHPINEVEHIRVEVVPANAEKKKAGA